MQVQESEYEVEKNQQTSFNSSIFQRKGVLGNDLPCGTMGDFSNQPFELSTKFSTSKSLQKMYHCVNIVFYIVRNDNGNGGYNVANIPAIMRNLNDVFNEHNIYLFNKDVKFINSSVFFDLQIGSNSEFPNLIYSNNSSNAINFYLVNSISNGANEYAGVAEGIPSKNLVVANNYALSPTSAHELGHCLNLFHTHRNIGEGGCNENINGSNCSSCGDYVCDTPADPGLGTGNIDFINCTYVGGGGYTPLVNNIMSYASTCRSSFTNGQSSRMKAALSDSSVLRPVIKTTCNIPEILGTDTLCNEATFTISNLPSNSSISWESTPNGIISLHSQTANGITVQRIFGMSGNVTLRARVNYPDGNRINIKKNIILLSSPTPVISLNPSAPQCISMGSDRFFYAEHYTGGTYQSINNNPNVTEIDWQVIDFSTSPPTPITNFQKYSNSVINSHIKLFLPYKSSDYVITIVPRVKHRCGYWGEWGPGYAYFIKSNCSSQFGVFDVNYNKSEKQYELNLSKQYDAIQKIVSKNLNKELKTSNKYNSLTIFDNENKIVYSQKFLGKISTPKLSQGNYTIELLQNGYIYRQSLNLK
ncbi:hypothetical protein CGC49_09350 [Capnocytophaga sp. H4358]|nr:hypothetical protein CGC49_09350 [Capnocytophaga sp. H4358]